MGSAFEIQTVDPNDFSALSGAYSGWISGTSGLASVASGSNTYIIYNSGGAWEGHSGFRYYPTSGAIYVGGNVGIGADQQANALLYLYKVFSSDPGSTQYAQCMNLTASVAAARTFYGAYNQATVSHTSGTVSAILGSNNSCTMSGSGGITTWAIALRAGLTALSGSGTAAWIVKGTLTGGATLGSLYGLYLPDITGASNCYGIRIDGSDDFGVYLSGMDSYAFYAADGANYFGGQIQAESQIMGKEIPTPSNPTAAYDHLYFKSGTSGQLYTLSSGGTEKALTWGLVTRTAQLYYSGGTAEQTLISGDFPGNSLTTGSAIRLWATGNGRSLSGTPGSVGFQVKTGATVIASGSFPLNSNQTGKSFAITADVTVIAAGGPGTCNGGIRCVHNFSGNAVAVASTSGTAAVTTTSAIPFQLTWTFTSGHSGNVIVCQNAGISISKV